ncbi:MAG: thiamine pyrophosphate-dependent enzyme, partial [Planctomycetota bacterium]
TRAAVDRARTGGGPSLIEALTFRMGGHSSSDDPTRYRDEAEVKLWRERDPLVRARQLLEGRGLWDETQEQAHHDLVMAQISEAIAQAERVPPPEPETLVQDVFAELPPGLAMELDQVKSFTQRRKR